MDEYCLSGSTMTNNEREPRRWWIQSNRVVIDAPLEDGDNGLEGFLVVEKSYADALLEENKKLRELVKDRARLVVERETALAENKKLKDQVEAFHRPNHIVGKVYEVNQYNMNKLIGELDLARGEKEHWYERFAKLEISRSSCCVENEEQVKRLRAALEKVDKRVSTFKCECVHAAHGEYVCPRCEILDLTGRALNGGGE